MTKESLENWRAVYRFHFNENSEITISGVKRPVVNLVLPGFIEGHKVISIAPNAFKNDWIIRTVTIPQTISHIGAEAFRDCVYLEKLTIEKSDAEIADSAFIGCERLAKPTGFLVVNQVLVQYFGTQEHVIIPNGVQRIGRFAFYLNLENERIRTITAPSSMATIPISSISCCPNLKHIFISSK